MFVHHLEDVPLDRHVELGQVDPDVHGGAALVGLVGGGAGWVDLLLVAEIDLEWAEDD